MRLVVDEWRGSIDELRFHRPHDLIVAGASWDSRSVLLAEVEGLAASHSLQINYEDTGASGRAPANEARIADSLCGTVANQRHELRIDSFDLYTSWKVVREHVLGVSASVGRPVDVILDLTSIPRNISLGLLGFGLRSGVVRSIGFFYAGATGYHNQDETGRYPFTRGFWTPWSVVGLGGISRPRSRNHLLVSVGFEGARTRRLVDTLEPDRVSVLFAEPGSSPAAERRAREENHELVEAYLVPERAQLTAPLGSALDARTTALGSASAQPVDDVFPEETSFLLCGPKLHSLGLAIASLELDSGDVYYVQPEAHSEVDSIAVGAVSVTRVARPWVGTPGPWVGPDA